MTIWGCGDKSDISSKVAILFLRKLATVAPQNSLPLLSVLAICQDRIRVSGFASKSNKSKSFSSIFHENYLSNINRNNDNRTNREVIKSKYEEAEGKYYDLSKMKMEHAQNDNIWLTKSKYEEAEIQYYENLSKAPVTSLAGEVAKARQLLIESRDTFKEVQPPRLDSVDVGAIKFFEKKVVEFEKTLKTVLDKLNALELRVTNVEKSGAKVAAAPGKPVHEINVSSNPKRDDDGDDDDVDLFGSDSEEENEAAAKIREERLAAYNAKKSKKPVLIAKSNVILDVKPWDDETDMKALEKQVREITMDGLLWGAAKLVPLAYGIHKLQISCVVEDDKVSIDLLQEQIAEIEDYVQSVDIAAFNKI